MLVSLSFHDHQLLRGCELIRTKSMNVAVDAQQYCKLRSVGGVREEDQLGVGQVLLENVGVDG